MRIPCPCCGLRDLREFTCKGAADYLRRPLPDASLQEWDDYLHIRDNTAGEARELWYHDPCGTWVCVTRDTATHAITNDLALEHAQ
jgi:heterotetrameric sarcosine oxidase delta subunit